MATATFCLQLISLSYKTITTEDRKCNITSVCLYAYIIKTSPMVNVFLQALGILSLSLSKQNKQTVGRGCGCGDNSDTGVHGVGRHNSLSKSNRLWGGMMGKGGGGGGLHWHVFILKVFIFLDSLLAEASILTLGEYSITVEFHRLADNFHGKYSLRTK